MFCPQAIAWGDIATWVASAGTFAAVVIALRTSNKALQQTRIMKDADDERLEKIRQLRAKAYSAAIVDELTRAVQKMSLASDVLGMDEHPDRARILSALSTLSHIQHSVCSRMLEHVEVFGDAGKVLARTAVGLMEVSDSAKESFSLLEPRGQLPSTLIEMYKTMLRKRIRLIQTVAPHFYDIAGIEPENRYIKPLTDDELTTTTTEGI